MLKRSWARGKPLSRLGPRRLPAVLVVLAILAILLLGSLPSKAPALPSYSEFEPKLPSSPVKDVPPEKFIPPSQQQPQLPLQQKINKYNGSSWLTDERSLSTTYSSSVTLDDERVLLPPLKARQPIYCYYDTDKKKAKDERDAESELLLTWRRAWWAQGFRPVVLSAAEAMNNSFYDQLQKMTSNSELRRDLMRWLAWDTMDGGILSEFTVLPIVPQQEPLLPFLRTGTFPSLMKWTDLDNAFIVGPKADVHSALQSILKVAHMQEAMSVTTALSDTAVAVNNTSNPLAYYSPKIVETKYAKLIKKDDRAGTLHNLNNLINYHLLVTWQNSFPDGIEVIKPHPEHATAMLAGALELAKSLASCPESPMLSSCPPNLPKCYPCVASPMAVTTLPRLRFRNSPHVFTIGVVPHPWSFALVNNLRESINVTWIVESPRDTWLSAVTQAYLGSGVTSSRRVVRFKELVAGEADSAHSLWLPAEDKIPSDMEWHFGFTIPEKGMDDGKSRSPVPAERLLKDEEPDKAKEIAHEQALLDRAKQVVMMSKSFINRTEMRTSLEAWNMADTEAWRFTRAFNARRFSEREEWEKTYRQR
ncbi:hypothetical protein M441DRAFT_61515 [Trichoderma asperellum CBS 433.97]|uniref:Uncharacterized protein n=1 Tax=Trichoderma asperellum (strain ATCC 204424 / CBS 433.97 / NBRC 101777) TaxID=1042311 RepID=A0A2T3YW46_TRIA4|nr:hypothetical protein M441DRAFT_61515 [Trichoderma asperellum CBS 433.97]PTB36789.1 hypothetical protein M441DRAFT_61515 [Trichoderma asperellum CBS 433.97]